jgi:uncharacterized protein YndB with AHSA1/START domain
MSSPIESVERIVLIHADPEVVFRFFTDSERWARWWGAGSTVDPRPGGRVYVRHPEGTESAGEILELDPPRRLVFTYGYVSGTPIPAGGSRVEIRLERDPKGTRLHLEHVFPPDAAATRDEHVQGWRFQLSLFANIVSDEVNRDAARVVDAWFEAWAEPDPAARERILGEVCTPRVLVRDRFSNLHGLGDLLPHIAAAQRFMPGVRLERTGKVRHCQGVVLADWTAAAGGRPRGRGTNVFGCDPSGRIEWVTGFWGEASGP